MTVNRKIRDGYEQITAVVMPDGWWYRPGWVRDRIAGWPDGGAVSVPVSTAEPLSLNAKADAWAAKRRSGT